LLQTKYFFQEAVRYVQRQEYESRLLDFIENEFLFKEGSENEINSNETEVRIFAFFSVIVSRQTSPYVLY
jgi:hypothetical protein